MADHSKPTLTSNYTAFVDEIKGRLEDISKGFDPVKTSPTNMPVDTIRWVSSSNKWQRWNGSSWVDLASTYAVNVATASRLQTGRTIALSGGATGSASFDGSANITINVTALNPSQLASPVPINKGGTGAASAAQARTNLGLGTAATRDVTEGNADVAAGRLLKVGDLGSNRRHAAVVDFNALPDLYPYSGPIPVMSNTGSTNGPPGRLYFYVEQHFYSSNGNVTQIAIPYRVDSEGLWMRSRFSETWSPWREIYHSGNLPDIDWNSLTGKPSTFPPSSHTHPWNQITGAPATATRWPTWGEVTGKPTIFPTNWDNVAGKPSGFTPPTTAGAVGTYAFVVRRSSGTTEWGQTIAGSGLAGSAAEAANKEATVREGGQLSGTWRIMGSSVHRSTSGTLRASLAVRIS